MSKDFDNDTHERLIQAFLNYCDNNTKFNLYGYSNSAVKARTALLEIYQLSKVRRKEIHDKKIKIHGHPRKGIEPTTPDERRQRKIERKIQKQQAKNQDNDN